MTLGVCQKVTLKSVQASAVDGEGICEGKNVPKSFLLMSVNKLRAKQTRPPGPKMAIFLQKKSDTTKFNLKKFVEFVL